MGLGFDEKAIKRLPKPYGVCPVCGHPLTAEEVPVGWSKTNDEGKQSKTTKLGSGLGIIIVKAIETTLFACVACKRPEYVVCHNEDCPLCWKLNKPYFLKRPLAGCGVGPCTLRGDSLGLVVNTMKASYRKKKGRNAEKKGLSSLASSFLGEK